MAATITNKAKRLGKDHGENAAAWYVQDAIDQTRDTVRASQTVLHGILDGDPEILDSLPWADLSGQWADGMTPADVYDDLGILPERDSDDMEYIRIYEDSYNDAVVRYVETQCRGRLR